MFLKPVELQLLTCQAPSRRGFILKSDTIDGSTSAFPVLQATLDAWREAGRGATTRPSSQALSSGPFLATPCRHPRVPRWQRAHCSRCWLQAPANPAGGVPGVPTKVCLSFSHTSGAASLEATLSPRSLAGTPLLESSRALSTLQWGHLGLGLSCPPQLCDPGQRQRTP